MHKDAPPAPPAAPSAHKKSESGGVIAMIDELVADLNKELTEAEAEEKNSQGDYEKTMADSAEKRATDTKALTDRESTRASLSADLEQHAADKKSTTAELMATDQYVSSLHAECDWLIKYFDVRSDARTNEIDAMQKAKAVLSGADYSLVQTRKLRSLRKQI